jgi:hypothetical protein
MIFRKSTAFFLMLVFAGPTFATEVCRSKTGSDDLYACVAKKLCGDCKYLKGADKTAAILKADKFYYVLRLNLPVEEVVHQGFPKNLYGEFSFNDREDPDLPTSVEIEAPGLVFQGAIMANRVSLGLTKKLKIADLELPFEVAGEVKLADIDEAEPTGLQRDNVVNHFRLKRPVKICGKIFPVGAYGAYDGDMLLTDGPEISLENSCDITRHRDQNSRSYTCHVTCQPGAFEDEAPKKKQK